MGYRLFFDHLLVAIPLILCKNYASVGDRETANVKVLLQISDCWRQAFNPEQLRTHSPLTKIKNPAGLKQG